VKPEFAAVQSMKGQFSFSFVIVSTFCQPPPPCRNLLQVINYILLSGYNPEYCLVFVVALLTRSWPALEHVASTSGEWGRHEAQAAEGYNPGLLHCLCVHISRSS
jgi:hypothetical protein